QLRSCSIALKEKKNDSYQSGSNLRITSIRLARGSDRRSSVARIVHPAQAISECALRGQLSGTGCAGADASRYSRPLVRIDSIHTGHSFATGRVVLCLAGGSGG